MYITRRKSTYLQIRNNRDLNFWLCGFSQTEHFSYPDLLNFPLQNILTLWWEEGLIISVYSGKKRKKGKENLGEIQSFWKGNKTKPNTKKVYQVRHLNTSFEEVIKKNETVTWRADVSIDEIMKFYSYLKSKAIMVHTLIHICGNTYKNILNLLLKFLLKK